MIDGTSKVIVANWKMNGSLELINSFSSFPTLKNRIIICPPSTLLFKTKEILPSEVNIGGQNCNDNDSGAYTGEISAAMLYESGARYVILGHSERRSIFKENNEMILTKFLCAIKCNLVPILCVGETLSEKKQNITKDVIKNQLGECIPAETNPRNLIIAYEPVWAIGTGLIPKLKDIEEIHSLIRNFLKQTFGQEAIKVPILYGGSANAKNCTEITSISDVGGLLVGGASLKKDEFLKICQA